MTMSSTMRAALKGIAVVIFLPFILIGLLFNMEDEKKAKLLGFFKRSDKRGKKEINSFDNKTVSTSASEAVKIAFKGFLALLLFPFAPLFLFFAGLTAKHKEAMLEGALYSGLFIGMLVVPTNTVVAFVGLGALIVSIIRLFHYRDLWLTKKADTIEGRPATVSRIEDIVDEPVEDLSLVDMARELSSDLARLTSNARRNKHRLPADAYISILECCQTLDSVVDAEKQTPSQDAQLRYELEAMINDYLPSVLENYLAIPVDMVSRRLPSGKTADEELTEQLELLQAQADSLYASRHGRTSTKLADTGNFLREKFGHHKQDQFDFGIS